MAIATSIMSNSITETKKIFFPIDKKFWLKIGLVSLLNGNSFPGGRLGRAIGDVTDIKKFIKTHIYTILAISSGLVIFAFLFSIIAYTFSFIFLESLFSKKILIKAYFKKFLNKGLSLFWLNLAFGLLNLAIILVFGAPLLTTLIKNWDNLSWSQFNIPYLIFFSVLVVLSLIFFGLLDFILNNFVLMDMYSRNIKALESLKKILKLIRANFFESFSYLCMKIVIGIVIAILSLIIYILLLLALAIIGIIIVLILYGIYLINSEMKTFLIAFGVIIALILTLILIYASAVILSPLQGFNYLYSFKFFNELKNRNKNFFKNGK